MRYKRLLKVLVVIMVLSLLLLVMPAASVMAVGEDISITPDEGEIGTEITVSGEDFNISAEGIYGAIIYFSSDEADVGDDIDDEVDTYKRIKVKQIDDVGEFSTTFDVPDEIYQDGDTDDERA
ncbi:hypothetical protein ACFLU4_05790, partial [Chloroflexota bacterium]